VIAVELARDLDDAFDGFEVSVPHGAMGDDHRFVEARDLKREKLGRRLGHPAGENVLDDGAHAPFAQPLAPRELRDRNALDEERHDPLLPLGLGRPRGAAGVDRPVAGRFGRKGRGRGGEGGVRGGGRGVGGEGRGGVEHGVPCEFTTCSPWHSFSPCATICLCFVLQER
jgi:hypothetical protein